MNRNSKNSKSIAAGSPCRSFDRARMAKGLFVAALSIATLAAPQALHAQQVSFAGSYLHSNTIVPSGGVFPYSLGVDGSRNLYVADSGGSQVVRITPSGVQTTLPISGLELVQGIAVDPTGDVLVANGFQENSGNGLVYNQALSGHQSSYAIISGSNQGIGVAIDYSGDLLFTQTNSNEVTEDIAYQPQQANNFVRVDNGSLSQPTALAMGPYNTSTGTQDVFIINGNSVVGVPSITTSNWNQQFLPNNQFTVPVSGLQTPRDIVVDGVGNLFISDTYNRRVVELPFQGNDASGNPIFGAQITLAINGLGKPWGLAVDQANDVFISDPDNQRIVEMEPETTTAPFGSVNVCPSGQTTPAPCSSTLKLTFNVTASGTLGTPQVLSQGLRTPATRNTDFTLASGSTCKNAVTAGSTCTVNVTFTPQSPGLRTGSVRMIDANGDILATVLLSGTGQGPQVAFSQAAQATVKSVSAPTGVAVDAAGNVFIAKQNGSVVVQGNIPAPPSGLGLGSELTLALDGNDDLFIADPQNNRVLKIAAKTEAETTVGSGLSNPQGVAVDGWGDVFIVDSGNNRVVEIQSTTGYQSTVPATGLSAPLGLAVDGAGNLYIADTGNRRVVELSPNGTQSVVGTGFVFPLSVAVDAAGDVFITDPGLDEVVEVSPSGTQTTVGTGLNGPYAVALDGAGDVFLADTGNNRVLEVQRSKAPSLSFPATAVSSASALQSVGVQNVGNQSLTVSSLSVGANFKQEPGSGTLEDCASNLSLTGGASCNLSILFTPYSTGSISSSAVLTDNSLNSTSATQTIKLSGTGTAQ